MDNQLPENLPDPRYSNPITDYEERDWFETIMSILFGIVVVFALFYGTWHLGRYYEITHPREVISPIPCSQQVR